MKYIFDEIESCECIGEFVDEYVYDIEMDDETHTFIGNDILVHNSLYISFSPLMETAGYEGDELKFILHMNACFVKHLFNDFLEKYAEPYGVKNIHDFELETINKAGLHLQKKMYINNTVWQDGAFYEDLSHLYPKGVDIVRSSTPAFVREKIWDFLNYLFTHPNNMNIRDLLKIVKDIKKQFMMADIEEISQTTSCTNYEQKVIEDQSGIECVKGAHFSVKAAALHNYLLNKNPEYKTKYDLIRSGKIKYYSVLPNPLGDKFAYLRSFHPNEIIEKEGIKIDYDEQFDKTFLSIANRFVEPVGLPPINRRLAVLNSLFGATTKKARPIEVEEVDEDEIKIIHTVDDFIGLEDDSVDDEVNEEKPSKIKEDIKTLDSDDTFDDFWS